MVAACDLAVTIPMPGGTESLNAAVAGAIVAYEVTGRAAAFASRQPALKPLPSRPVSDSTSLRFLVIIGGGPAGTAAGQRRRRRRGAG